MDNTCTEKKECFICLNTINQENHIELSCCKSTECCKNCIKEWVIKHNKESCPKCRSTTEFINTCKKNNIEIPNIEYYIKIYNLHHPSVYFSSPYELESRNLSYISDACKCSYCTLAKYYSCMCPTCINKISKINILHENDTNLHLDEIFDIIDIMDP